MSHFYISFCLQLSESNFEYSRVAALLTSINSNLQCLSKFVLLSKLDGVKSRIDTAKHTVKKYVI